MTPMQGRAVLLFAGSSYSRGWSVEQRTGPVGHIHEIAGQRHNFVQHSLFGAVRVKGPIGMCRFGCLSLNEGALILGIG